MRDLATARTTLLHVARAGTVALLASTLTAGAAHAYRPFDGTDADVAQPRRIEVELGPVAFAQQGDERALLAPNLGLSYGLGAGLEFGIEGVNWVPLDSEDESGAHLEEVAAEVKKVLRRGSLQDESGFSVATEVGILFPARGEDRTGASVGMVASSSSKRSTTHLNVELLRLPAGEDGVACGWIYESGDQDGLYPVLELGLEAVRGELPTKTALVGLVYVPREGLEYDLALRAGQSNGERLLEVRCGLTLQIRPSRVLEHAATALGHPPKHRRRH